MIAKIGKGENLYGAISYNQKKIDSENGQVMLLNRIPETLDNTYSVSYLHSVLSRICPQIFERKSQCATYR